MWRRQSSSGWSRRRGGTRRYGSRYSFATPAARSACSQMARPGGKRTGSTLSGRPSQIPCGSGFGVCEIQFMKGTDIKPVLHFMNDRILG